MSVLLEDYSDSNGRLLMKAGSAFLVWRTELNICMAHSK